MTGRPLTVAMTPSFWDDTHMLLRAQLRCLAEQRNRDFDVMLVDPHYRKRRTVVPELAEAYGLEIVHVPYEPNVHVAKKLDCAIFNAAYCYSTSPRIVRYSCYRFATPYMTERLLGVTNLVNVDMYSLNVGPCLIEEETGAERVKHKTVWDFEGDAVNWDAIPRRPGLDADGEFVGDPSLSLARWSRESDVETDPIPVPLNCYGNIMWWRENWLDVNGTEEVVTNSVHWEDIDFDQRTNLAGQRVVRIPRLMYRLCHPYGRFSQRSNVEVDVPFKAACPQCDDFFARTRDLQARRSLWNPICLSRVDDREIVLHEAGWIWTCRACGLSGPMWIDDESDYWRHLREVRKTMATILHDPMIGRNLRILAEDMDRCGSVAEKFEIYQGSWTNPRYHVR